MNRTIKLGRTVAVASAITLALGACSSTGTGGDSGASSLEDMEPIVLVYADLNAENSSMGRAASEFMKEVTEKSGGKITFDTYFSGSLFTPADGLGAVSSGIADISYYTTSFAPQELAVSNWLNQAASQLIQNYPAGWLQSTGATVEQYLSNEDIQKEFASQGVKPLWFGSSAQFDMLCVDPIASLADVEGRITRTAGGAWAGEVEALGMSSTFLPPTELYESFQRGVVDCGVVVPSFYIPAGLWEVAKTYVPMSMSPSAGGGFIMSQDRWDSLPAAAQDIIIDAMATFVVGSTKYGMEAYQQWATEGVDKQGIQFVDPTEFNAVLGAQQAKVRGELVGAAPASVSDAAGALKAYEELHGKWRGVVEQMGVSTASQTPAEVIEAYRTAIDAVDWDAYAAALKEVFNAHR